jgi:Ca2+-binding RTX toxin-like protein
VVVTQSGGSTAVTEGGAGDAITLALSRQPTANVSVTVTGTPDVTVAAGGGTQAGSTPLTFTAANWSTAQTVNLAAVNDTLVEGPETANLAFATSSADAGFNALTVPPLSVSVTDNDQAVLPSPGKGGRVEEGTAGNDTLRGGPNGDVLAGRLGNDTLTGRGGADQFVFATGDGRDVITDFAPRTDKLVFQGITAAAVTQNAASGSAGIEVHYGSGGDYVLLSGVTALLAQSDFIFQ